jgi:hypothetical protein
MGYSYDKTTKTIEVDTNRAADAIAVFETFIATNGNRRLSSERLNAAGVLTRDGNLWSEDVIADFIRNPLYQGIIKYEDIETFVQIPEVVPLKLVSSAVALCQPGRPRERSSKRLYVYSGLLVCGDCGRTLKVHTTNRVSSWAYVCRGRKDYGVCRGRSIGSGRIDRLVGIGLETALSAARDSLLRLAEESAQDATTEAQEQAFARRHANLQESRAKTVDLYVAGIISREDMEHRVGEIDRQLKECDKPKEKPPVFTADMLSGMLVKWPEKWVAMDAADKRALVLNTCSRVVVKPESIVLDTNLPCGLVTVDE